MIKIVCDRCSKEIPGPMAGRIAWAFAGDYARDVFKNCHFCPVCMEEIKEFIQAPVAQDSKEEAMAAGKDTDGQEPPIWVKGDRKEKDIDMGRVTALRNAGWTIKEIADDMSLTARQVSEAICQHRDGTAGKKDP